MVKRTLPVPIDRNTAITVTPEQGAVRITVDSSTDEKTYLNFLSTRAVVVRPDQTQTDVTLLKLHRADTRRTYQSIKRVRISSTLFNKTRQASCWVRIPPALWCHTRLSIATCERTQSYSPSLPARAAVKC